MTKREKSSRKIVIEDEPFDFLRRLRPKAIRRSIDSSILSLKELPEKGKLLHQELASYRSLPVYNGRYRVIYHFDENAVFVDFIGPREPGMAADVYELFKEVLSGEEGS